MPTIRLQTKLQSDTVHLPELRPLVGKTVEMIVWEQGGGSALPGTGDWRAFETALDSLRDYDFDAWREQRELDVRSAHDRVP